MGGDYSRKRFDPRKHFSGVLKQQGRVDLDSEWNESVDLLDRRLRAQTIDLVGRCGVPSETPNGFKVENSGGEITIGPGRIYVDGLLAENHGTQSEFSAALEEDYGTAPIKLAAQPYVPVPPEAPAPGCALVYLVVWRREVTHHLDPGLVEPALSGADTATRYQTVWQVRVLDGLADDATCATPLDNWPPKPSAARLTTDTVALATDVDPCLIPPSGGYRGLGNHLYRLEVHDVQGGTVRIKWSRENASVASRILEILPGRTIVRVDSLWRDDVLRFKTGDWVEITGNGRELAGLPGEMRRVTSDDGDHTLSFADALPAAEFPEGAAQGDAHFHAIRWDQAGIVRRPNGTELINLDSTTDGLIPLTSTDNAVVLENGIRATLEVGTGGTARTGDYWCFAARTADADVEKLDQSPPQGIHRHYCKLAIVQVDAEGQLTVVEDCRRFFPAEPDEPGVRVDQVLLTDGASGVQVPLANDAVIASTLLADGIRIRCTSPIAPESIVGEPVARVTLDLPFPLVQSAAFPTGPEQIIGYQQIRLAATLSVQADTISWLPGAAVQQWLKAPPEGAGVQTLFDILEAAELEKRILARLTANGNFIWSQDDPGHFLDGDTFGQGEEDGRTVVRLPSGDGRRGGDFRMWFWLVPTLQLASLTVTPAAVAGGNPATGVVTLSGTAPAGGVLVGLASSQPAVAAVPPSVTVAAGQLTAQFTVRTQPVPVGAVVQVVIMALLGTVEKQAQLMVRAS
jgi:hypothetical protein